MVNNIKKENNFYNNITPQRSLENQTVILVDDAVDDSHAVIAPLRSIQRQRPFKVVVVVPFITNEAFSKLVEEVDELIYLHKDQKLKDARDLYKDSPHISKEDVQNMLEKSKAFK